MKINSSIRLVAQGVAETFLVIWEDGTIYSQLKGCYPALEDALEEMWPGDITVSTTPSHTLEALTKAHKHLALNTERNGDFFLYVHQNKTAFFQVPREFGALLRDNLTAYGVPVSHIIFQSSQPTQKISARQIVAEAKRKKFLGDPRPTERASAAIYELNGTTDTGAVEKALAGFAACTVM
jgi:hypothetical protein